MSNKQNLINYLFQNGKSETMSWADLATEFGLKSAEVARHAWRSHKKFINKYPILTTPVQTSWGYFSQSTPKVITNNEVEAGIYIADLENEVVEQAKIIEEKVNNDGSKDLKILSNKALSRKEIEELYGVDNISTKLSNYWNKETPSGKFITSAFIKCLIEDFYSVSELESKLKEIFPTFAPIRFSNRNLFPTKALFVYISDDHCGSVLKNSLYNNEYSGKTYAQRLLELSSQIRELNQTFEKVFIISLGDEMDGYNAKTTRYDHSLDSQSNKEQFDIYTTARTIFYNDLFTSNISNDYTIVNLNNSNHTGLGFSYIANKAVEYYIQGRFPQVKIQNIEKFIETLEYGNHIFGFTHGKDEKYMKSPLPLNLDSKTDLWLFDYYDNKGYSPKKHWISTVKGDIHKYNVNIGKSGRYVNIPSISSGSTWIEHNYGNSTPGAVLEIVYPNTRNIQSTPIWF